MTRGRAGEGAWRRGLCGWESAGAPRAPWRRTREGRGRWVLRASEISGREPRDTFEPGDGGGDLAHGRVAESQSEIGT